MQDTNADRFASHSGAACGPTDSQGRAALLRPSAGRGGRARRRGGDRLDRPNPLEAAALVPDGVPL